MKKHEEAANRARRNFLKAAGGAAAGLVAAKDLCAQSAAAKSAARKDRAPEAPGDRGMWITWYDLPENGREDYFSWLHSDYLPALLKRPGYEWAAHYASVGLEGGAANDARYKHVDDPRVGKGFHYMLLIAAVDAKVFGNPVPSLLHASLPEQGRKMLKMRMGERVNLFTETCRGEGTAGATYKEGMISAPCIQVGSFNCELEFEEEMHAGYVLQRMPKMCATPSCVRVRKLNSVAGWAKHGIVYEFASKEGFDRDYAPTVANATLGFGAHSCFRTCSTRPTGPTARCGSGRRCRRHSLSLSRTWWHRASQAAEE